MVNIIPKKTEEKLNFFHDLDGTQKKHSKTEIILYKILIPSAINGKNSNYRKVLTAVSNAYAPLSNARAFSDVSRIPEETSSFAKNSIYTLNSQKAIRQFLRKNSLEKYFDEKISLPFKNPEILESMLREYQESPEESVAVLFGDTIADLKNTYNGKSITVGFSGPLERDQNGLSDIADIYIPEKIRENAELSRFLIYEGLERKMNNLGISPKQKIRKEVSLLKETYEKMLS